MKNPFPIFLRRILFRSLRDPALSQPGEYAPNNKAIIESIIGGYSGVIELWTDEANEAKDPRRRAECLEIAEAAKRLLALQLQFYSRWKLRP